MRSSFYHAYSSNPVAGERRAEYGLLDRDHTCVLGVRTFGYFGGIVALAETFPSLLTNPDKSTDLDTVSDNCDCLSW
jgi:hypothetical protein